MIVLCVGIGAAIAFSQSSATCGPSVADSIYRSQQLALEAKKVELEERKLFLLTLASSSITEESARKLSDQILNRLQDYAKGKKAKHRDQDVQLLTETLAALQSKRVP